MKRLTKRETDVLLRVSMGDRTKQAAHVLGISARTVEKYKTRAMKKLAGRCFTSQTHGSEVS